MLTGGHRSLGELSPGGGLSTVKGPRRPGWEIGKLEFHASCLLFS